jgi:hypothetical protein
MVLSKSLRRGRNWAVPRSNATECPAWMRRGKRWFQRVEELPGTRSEVPLACGKRFLDALVAHPSRCHGLLRICALDDGQFSFIHHSQSHPRINRRQDGARYRVLDEDAIVRKWIMVTYRDPNRC